MDVSLVLDPASSTPLHQQLYTEIRSAILVGRFSAAEKLPSSRALAQSLSVSRMTVTECYGQLIAEGYLEPRRGSGTYVCSILPELAFSPASRGKRSRSTTAPDGPIRLSRYGIELQTHLSKRNGPAKTLLRLDYLGPDVSNFPTRLWSRLLARHSRNAKRELFEYAPDSRGHQPLREAIAHYLRKARAVRCDAEQVILVSGSQQAVDLSARVLLNDGDAVAIENPGYLAAARVFSAQGATLSPVDVDEEGMVVAKLDSLKSKPPKLVYVTPSHQFPTGASLSLARRLALLKWARQHGSVIFEDDYDSEYRYSGRPLPSLQGMASGVPVLYVGTFSKTLFPGLRIGYAVVPKSLIRVFARAKFLSDRQGPSIEQYALTDFLNEGHYERHIRRMRQLYGRRRGVLADALSKHFGEAVTIRGDNSGMHLYAEFTLNISEQEAFTRAIKAGLRLERVHRFDEAERSRSTRSAFIFGFARLSERTIRDGVARLAIAFRG
jgi:GntR family transcriptional regulator/MocR family aminotransferase